MKNDYLLKAPLNDQNFRNFVQDALDSKFYRALDQTIAIYAKKYDYSDLSKLLDILRKKRIKPSSETFKTIEDRIKSVMNLNTPTATTNILWGFASLGHVPDTRLIKTIIDHLQNKPEFYDDTHYARSLYALVLLDSVSKGTIRKKHGLNFEKEIKARKFDHPAEQKMIHDSCLWLDISHDTSPGEESDKHSAIETQLTSAFNKAGIPAKMQSTHNEVDEIGHTVDIALRYNEQIVHVEFDGPWHFNRELVNNYIPILNGSTIFQTALMRKIAPDQGIIRINHNDLSGKENDADLLEFVNRLEDSMYQHPTSGVYMTRKKGSRIKLKPLSL